MSTQSANDDIKSPPPASGLEAAREKVGDAAGAARNATVDVYAAARDKVGTVLEDASEKASAAYGDIRDKVGRAADATRENAGVAGRKASEGIQDNPFAALIGGLALGAIAAAILPRTEREAAALGPLGSRLNDIARQAAMAAKSAGKDKMDELGLTPDRAQDTVSKLFADVAKAASSAGAAAAGSVRQSAS